MTDSVLRNGRVRHNHRKSIASELVSMQKSTLQELLLLCFLGWGIFGLIWLMPLKSRIRIRYGKAATYKHLKALSRSGDADAIEHMRRGRIWAALLAAIAAAIWTVKWYW